MRLTSLKCLRESAPCLLSRLEELRRFVTIRIGMQDIAFRLLFLRGLCGGSPQMRWFAQTTTRTKLRKCDETSGENPEKSVVSFFCVKSPTAQRRVSTPKAFASHYRLNAINFRSLRRWVKASPAIAKAPPTHVLGSGTGAWITVSTMSLLPSPPM